MRRYLFLAALLLLVLKVSAQSYTCSPVKEDVGNTAMYDAEQKYKLDKAGVKNALIIVNFTGTDAAGREKFKFDGGSSASIIKVSKEGEVWLFITSNSTSMDVKHNDYGNQHITFKALQANRTYKMEIAVKEKVVSNEIVKEVTWRSNIEASILIEMEDGNETGTTPYSIKRVPKGSYRVKLTKDYYKTIDTVVYVDKSHNSFSFKMREDFAIITLSTDKDSKITIKDSKNQTIATGNGSWSNRLLSGQYVITVSKNNHKDQIENLTVVPGRNETKVLKSPIPRVGTIEIESNKNGYEVYIDNKKEAESSGKITRINNVLIGEHSIKLHKFGFYDRDKTVTVYENQTSRMSFNLMQNWKDHGMLDRRFFLGTYSTRGNVGYMGGGMYDNSVGLYAGYQIGLENIYMYPDMRSKSRRLSIGAAYAISDWWYVYGGPALVETMTETDSLQTISADLGFMFRFGGVSVLAGAEYDFKSLNNNPLFFNFGFGFNLNNDNDIDLSQFSYVFSPSAPLGLMWTKHNAGMGYYAKIQTGFLENLWRSDYHKKRYSLTAGANYHITDWMSLYMGAGVGATQYYVAYDSSYTDFTWGADLETGLSFNIEDKVSLSLGAHRVNAFDKSKAYTEFDIAIGSTSLFKGRRSYFEERTIFEYTWSNTAPIGFMTGVIYDNHVGYYARIQRSDFSNDNLVNEDSDFWQGSRASLTMGPIFALANGFAIHGGLGAGRYRPNLTLENKIGFEAEVGASLYLGPVSLSVGPHWCDIGGDNSFLDWNIGAGLALRDLYDMKYYSDFVTMIKYTYTAGAPVGFELGGIMGVPGMYFGMQFGENRFNTSLGLILSTSAFSQVQFGVGTGFYSKEEEDALKADDTKKQTTIGIDFEVEYNLNLGPFPISVGTKLCRVGSDEFFVETMLGFGILRSNGKFLFF